MLLFGFPEELEEIRWEGQPLQWTRRGRALEMVLPTNWAELRVLKRKRRPEGDS